MDWLKNFDLRHWWIAVLGAGVAIATASIAVHFIPTILVGFGVGTIGVGEWINHPLQEKVGFGFKVSGYPRSPNVAGILLDIAGGVVLLFGLYRLLTT